MAQAQFGRGVGDWSTSGADAHRSSWVRTDPKISKDSMLKPGFQFLWKVKLNNEAKQSNSLTPPALLTGYIGYRGFRSLGFVGGSSDNVYGIDTDLARIEWQKHFALSSPAPAPQGGSLTCPGGMTANLARSVAAAFPAALDGRGGPGGGGRGGPARSGVGEPGQGAVTLAASADLAGRGGFPGAPGGPGVPAAPGAPGVPGRGGSGGFGRTPNFVYALSSDGMLHSMYVSNGAEPEPPVRFLPANANAAGLIVVDNVAYAATTRGCGGVPDGVWALDLASRKVAHWESNGGGVSGSAGPAIGPDGTLYGTTGAGKLVALEPKTLKLKGSYTAEKQEFTSSPVVFQYKEKTLIAAATKDGRIHLLDSSALGGALYKTRASSNAADFAPGALASWQGFDGTRWLLAPTAGAVVAWKVADQNGALSLQPGWVSRDLASPLTPMIINGVVFAVSRGRSKPAVLYALDATSGKELWNSGTTITSFVHTGGLSGGGSQLYLGTHDGTLFAFGFPIEH